MRLFLAIVFLLAANAADAALMPWCPCAACRTLPNNIHNLREQAAITTVPQQARHATPPTPAAEPVVYSTPPDAIDTLLGILDLRPDHVFLDLGCGEGRVLEAAVSRSGCKGIGVEIVPRLADAARTRLAKAGLGDRIVVITGDAADYAPLYTEATYVYIYLHGHDSAKLVDLVPEDAIVITYDFPVPGRICNEIQRNGHRFYLVDGAAKAARKRRIVYPDYVFRVWTADWCGVCKSREWQDTIDRLDAIPGVGIQIVDYDRYRAYARKHGIGGVPAIQLYEVRDRKLDKLLSIIIGRTAFGRLKRLIPE